MRVVHIIKVIRVAGAEQHLLMLLAGLRVCDVDARMILLVEPHNPMDVYVQALEARGVPVQRMVIRHHLDVGLYRRLWRELRALKPDIVHTHLIHADVYGIPAARLAGVSAVVTSRHNDDRFRYRLPVRAVNWLLWRMADAGIAISDAIRRFSVDIEGAPERSIQRIHYGLETDQEPLNREAAQTALRGDLKLDSAAVLIGVVCRLVEQKGVAYGLEAFSRVAGEFPNSHLLIVGEGPLRPLLEQQAAQANLKSRVHFLGWRADVNTVLASLDMLLAPSLWEGFGLVMLEAMAQQVPVIASAVSAIPEVVVHGETGLLVPARDVTALAEALRQLLGDKPLRQHMGLLGRDRLETHFSAARMVQETAALYQRVRR